MGMVTHIRSRRTDHSGTPLTYLCYYLESKRMIDFFCVEFTGFHDGSGHRAKPH